MKLFLLVVMVTAISQGADARPLTFAQALDAAASDAPTLAARGLQAEAARAAAKAAAALPDPQVQFGFEGFPTSGANAFDPKRDDFSAVRIGITQDVPAAAKRRARAERATADIGSADAGRRTEARNVQIATGLAWIDLSTAARKLTALDTLERSISALSRTAPARTVTGSLRPGQSLEPARLRADLADRRSALRAFAARARAELTRWTGDPAPDVAGPPPEITVDAAELRAGLDELPSLQVYGAIAAQADADVRLAQAERHPDWGWQASFAARDPRFGNMAAAGVTIGLPIFKRRRQDPLAAAKVLAAQGARRDGDAARRAATAALDGDLADHIMHHDRLHTATETLVPLAEKRAALERASYAAGRASLGDALEAALALGEAQTDLIDRAADVTREAVRITLTYGSDR